MVRERNRKRRKKKKLIREGKKNNLEDTEEKRKGKVGDSFLYIKGKKLKEKK